ncbi:MAG TPA: NAD-dependent epimerase/dehydratase family protein [Terriglobales bacterium]|jgi:nucleoside-diphosphate-sugar epimerase
MESSNPSIVVTGISGNLGVRLLEQLDGFNIIGIDLKPPKTSVPLRFVHMDLGQEKSCMELTSLMKESGASAVAHLAFVLDPVRNRILDKDRMWHINVAGTARVMEAVTEANRDEVIVKRFIFPSSVSAYGPDLPGPVTEDYPLGAHSLTYAIHKMEADKIVQQRAPSLRGCSAYMLRPHIFAGATVENYQIGAFRGTPNGKGEKAAKMRAAGKRLPCVLPMGKKYVENRVQFVHVDDVARLIAHIARKTEPETQRLTVLNVAGRGEPLTVERCLEMAGAKLKRVPGKWMMRLILNLAWNSGASAIPPEALPYMISEYIMNTDRLQKFLGPNYKDVIRYTMVDAFAESVGKSSSAAASAGS